MKRILIAACLLSGLLAGCQSTDSSAASQSNVSYESHLFGITFQHPREWQVAHVFDSGGVGLMISDADPNKVFGYANRTGNEIALILLGGGEAKSGSEAVDLLEKVWREPINANIVPFAERDRQFAYCLDSGKMEAVIIHQEKIYWLSGDYPAGEEASVQNGLETILRSLAPQVGKGIELSDEKPIGQRNEGLLKTEAGMYGYLPSWSTSIWTFKGKAGQEIKISIAADTQAKLTLDILDKAGGSILPEGPVSSAGNFVSDPIRLPEKGTYTIQISASPVMGWYGRYTINLE